MQESWRAVPHRCIVLHQPNPTKGIPVLMTQLGVSCEQRSKQAYEGSIGLHRRRRSCSGSIIWIGFPSVICATGISCSKRVFYRWQRHLFDNAAIVFADAKPSSRQLELEAEVVALRAKLAKKEHVIAELSEELIDAKKLPGAP